MRRVRLLKVPCRRSRGGIRRRGLADGVNLWLIQAADVR